MVDDLNRAGDWWWIDYLEDEMDAGLEADLEFLLHNSQEDRDSFEQFRLVREWVRDSDPVLNIPITDERMKRVRSSVMSAIETSRTPSYSPTAVAGVGKLDTKVLSV